MMISIKVYGYLKWTVLACCLVSVPVHVRALNSARKKKSLLLINFSSRNLFGLDLFHALCCIISFIKTITGN